MVARIQYPKKLTMTLEDTANLAILTIAAMTVVAIALIIWASVLLLRVQRLTRSLETGRLRDHFGRPLRERL
jgi:hypothetical protein